jgi:alkanesulfonate monooxygenase SsuD/methylene tetrahydromethanopterin reductase-like flavin-dependent oxidoreductase (luciferase family)
MSGGELPPLEFARAAEDVGFDSLWGGDHVIVSLDGLTLLGLFAGATSRVTVGTNVVVAPLRHPALIAHSVLTVAYAARRKVVLGVGVGGERPDEFALVGADHRRRGRYTDEALQAIGQLWTQHPASFRGEWCAFDEVDMLPKVEVAPEVWVGGRSEAAIRRALTYGTGYTPYLVSPKQLADRYEKLQEMAAASSRPLEDFTLAVTTFFLPGRNVDDAIERWSATPSFSGAGERQRRGSYLLGNEDDCLAKLQEYVDTGAQHILIGCYSGAGSEQGKDYFRMFERIRDAAQKLSGRRDGGGTSR